MAFVRSVVTRAESIGGGFVFLLRLAYDGSDEKISTSLLVLGFGGLLYGAYDAYREERLMRDARERLLRVKAGDTERGAAELIAHHEPDGRLTRVHARFHYTIWADGSTDQRILTDGATLRVVEQKTEKRFKLFPKTTERVLAEHRVGFAGHGERVQLQGPGNTFNPLEDDANVDFFVEGDGVQRNLESKLVFQFSVRTGTPEGEFVTDIRSSVGPRIMGLPGVAKISPR